MQLVCAFKYAAFSRRCGQRSVQGMGLLMTNRWISGIAVGFLAAQAQAALAAPTLEQCRALQDAQARLACYDGMSGPAVAPALPLDPAAAQAAQEEKFGLSQRQQASKEGLPEVDEVHATITEVSGTVVRLDNGHSWKMTTQNKIYDRLRPGQSVTIKRGMPSGFRLHVDGLNGMENVRRLN